jgi:hypothetical protein
MALINDDLLIKGMYESMMGKISIGNAELHLGFCMKIEVWVHVYIWKKGDGGRTWGNTLCMKM